MSDDGDLSPDLIAIIGMAGRFPGAPDLDQFWANLVDGAETYGPLDGQDAFDASFFGCTDGEALLLDPQQRVFLETCWAALEDAGQDPGASRHAIGVYAGSSETEYPSALRSHRERLAFVSEWQIRTATGMDFLTGRVAYKLGLRGPAVTVQTACSTSLVAVHLATQALLGGDCDMALAGGVTVHLWSGDGQDDDVGAGLLSSDGHCRAFDAAADGTVFSNGAGVVVLKRLADAVADRDDIRALVLGSAINNDGPLKIGFTAPSIAGQSKVIRDAHLAAGVDPDTIGYVEAHGTGTPLGDPIEVTALTSAFRRGTQERGFCRIGSVKTNIGHSDAAAGAAGLIKTVLAMRHGVLPASLNFAAPNPAIDFTDSPFDVVTSTRPWPRDRGPRRAGVSALGIGGTNAHVVLQEWTPPAVPAGSTAPWQLLVVSARSERAVTAAAHRLAEHLRRRPETDLADAAWTLQTGRRAYAHRRFAVAADLATAVGALSRMAARRNAVPGSSCIVFAFPGQGGQHVGMAEELYRYEPEFRTQLDQCAELAGDRLGLDLRAIIRGDDLGERSVYEMAVGQPAVFAVEYALACLLRSWGIRPDLVVGHSLGAYAAACFAGVMSLPDAMALVIERGLLLQSLPAGAMLAVPLPADEVAEMLGEELDLAVVNSPAQCVVAGPPEPVGRLRRKLTNRGIDARLLRIPVSAHSRYVEPVADAFAGVLSRLELREPVVSMLSELTGRPLTAAEATSPGYWSRHLRQQVRFADVLGALFAEHDTHTDLRLVEVGPGQTLTAILRRHPGRPPGCTAVPLLPHPEDESPQLVTLLTAVGELWSAGATVDWTALHGGTGRYRVPLPTYPFERRRYAVDPPSWIADPSPTGAVPASVGTDAAVPEPVRTVAPATATETQVATLFAQVLGLPAVEPPDNLFALGGDSVIAAQLVRSLRHAFGIRLPLRALFTNPTVTGLARHIDTQLRDQTTDERSTDD